MPRALKNLDVTLGLAVIPVQLFTATSSQGVAFHLLHAKCGSRIQMRLECPIHGIVPREETVKGRVRKATAVRWCPRADATRLRRSSAGAWQPRKWIRRWQVGDQEARVLIRWRPSRRSPL